MIRNLLGVFLILIAIVITIAAYVLPTLMEMYALSGAQYFLLIIVLISFSIVIANASLEYIITLPLDQFTKNLVKTWQDKKDLSFFEDKNLPRELENILEGVKIMTVACSSHIKELESKNGYTDSYYRLITTMSHQLRTPITGLKWALGSIQDDLLKGKTLDTTLISQMYQATVRSSAIIEDLLSGVFKQNSGQEAKSAVDIEKSLAEIVSESLLIGRERNINISVQHLSGQIPLIYGYARQISFVIHALISNAIYYGESGSTVTIRTSHDDSKVKVSVHDVGISISDEDKAMPFSQFRRSKEAIRINPNGAGLSLHIAEKILLDHDGSLSFESKAKDGTTFTFTLPLSHRGELETFIRY